MKNTQIGDLSTSCHITKNDTGLYNVSDINKLVQGSLGHMPVMKMVNSIWRYIKKVTGTMAHEGLCQSCKPFLFTCKFSQGNKILSDCKNYIVVESRRGNIILDCQIKTFNISLTGVKFPWKICPQSAQLTKSLTQPQGKDINILHAELGHPSEVITQATDMAIGLNFTGTLNLVKIVPWERPKRVSQ